MPCACCPSVGPPASFTIRADWFDRGNVRASARGQEYADAFPCIWNAGRTPNQSEYVIDFPASAEYAASALYAAAESRPVDILLDGRQLHRGFAGVTGRWQTSSAAWETQCAARITAGSHVLTLRCPGPCMPHICALRFEAPVAFPPGWRLARGAARVRGPAVEPFVPRAHRLLTMELSGDGGRLAVEVLRTGAGAAAGPRVVKKPSRVRSPTLAGSCVHGVASIAADAAEDVGAAAFAGVRCGRAQVRAVRRGDRTYTPP